MRFATKPGLARTMIARALDAGTPAGCVAGDMVYGNDPNLRADIAGRRLGFVLAVAKDQRITTGIGFAARSTWPSVCPTGPGSGCPPGAAKGPRVYDWPDRHHRPRRPHPADSSPAYSPDPHPPPCNCAGPDGDAATKPSPAPATTDADWP